MSKTPQKLFTIGHDEMIDKKGNRIHITLATRPIGPLSRHDIKRLIRRAEAEIKE
jgi:hypothetical protein